MWPQSYWPGSYWPGSYWPKTGFSVSDPDLCPPFGMVVINPVTDITVVNVDVDLIPYCPVVVLGAVNLGVALEVICG